MDTNPGRVRWAGRWGCNCLDLRCGLGVLEGLQKQRCISILEYKITTNGAYKSNFLQDSQHYKLSNKENLQ